MSNKLLLLVIVVSLIIGAIAGMAVNSALDAKPVFLPGETKTEIVIKKIPVRITETKFIERNIIAADSLNVIPPFAFSDSLKGVKDSVEYEVVHMIEKLNDSVKSSWNINVNSIFKEYIKEKLVVELKEVEVVGPFYQDGWFWSTLIAVPLLLLAIIF